MKKRCLGKKILGVFMAAALSCMAFAGCGRSSSSGSSSGKDTLTSVLQSKKLKVGCILANAPYGSKDASGNPEGYDVDVAYLLADSLGIDHSNVEFVDLNAADRIPALESGKVDVVIGNFTITLERAQKVDFTDPYDAGAVGVMTSPDKKIEHASELAGKKVAAAKGSTNQVSAEKLNASGVNFDLTLYDSADDMEMALQSGQVDAIIGDAPYCSYKEKISPDKYAYCVKDSSEMLMPAFYNAFGVQRGDTEWLQYLNQFIFQINTDGSNDELYEKYLGKRTTPLNPNY